MDSPRGDGDTESERPTLEEERELAALIRDHDDDDPMKAFLIQEKKEAIVAKLAQLRDDKTSKSNKKTTQHRHDRHRRRSYQSKAFNEPNDSIRHR